MLKSSAVVLAGLFALAGCSSGEPQAVVTVTQSAPAATPATEETATPTATPTETATEASDEDYYPWPSSYTTLSDRQWKKIVRDPDRYAGKGIIVYAEVFQFDAATGRKAFLGYASNKDERSYGYWDGDDTTAFVSPDKKRVRNVVEDDIVRVKAVVDSSYSYETQIGGNTTVPMLYIDKIEVIGSTD